MIRSMTEVFEKREADEFRSYLKHLRYVFNDHFVLVIVFFLGALGFYYQDILSYIYPYDIILMLIWGVFLYWFPYFGKLRTDVKSADVIHLTSQEEWVREWISKNKKKSLIAPAIFYGISIALMMPIVSRLLMLRASDGVYLWGSLMLLKWTHFSFIENSFYRFKLSRRYKWAFRMLNILNVFMHLISLTWSALIIVAVFSSALRFIYGMEVKRERLNWIEIVDYEEVRKQKELNLLAMFVDIKGLKIRTKRRPYFDVLLKLIPRKKRRIGSFLILRSFLRSGDYLSLFVRLLVIGSLLISFVESSILRIVFAGLILLMILLQMRPLLRHFNQNILMKVYPISLQEELKSGTMVIHSLGIFTAVLFSFFSFLAGKNIQGTGAMFIVLVLITIVHAYSLNKKNKN